MTLYVGRVRGGFSGGTVASAFAMAEDIATIATAPWMTIPSGP